MTDTHQRLIDILVEAHELAPERLEMDAPLAGLGIDSLATIELLWDIEDRFGVKLTADPAALVTIGDLVRHIDDALLPPLQGQTAVAAAAPP